MRTTEEIQKSQNNNWKKFDFLTKVSDARDSLVMDGLDIDWNWKERIIIWSFNFLLQHIHRWRQMYNTFAFSDGLELYLLDDSNWTDAKHLMPNESEIKEIK
jgi:hypothetical protein